MFDSVFNLTTLTEAPVSQSHSAWPKTLLISVGIISIPTGFELFLRYVKYPANRLITLNKMEIFLHFIEGAFRLCSLYRLNANPETVNQVNYGMIATINDYIFRASASFVGGYLSYKTLYIFAKFTPLNKLTTIE